MPQKTPVPVYTNWLGRELNHMLPVVTGDGMKIQVEDCECTHME